MPKCRSINCDKEVIGKFKYCTPKCRSQFRRKTRPKVANPKPRFIHHKFYSSKAWLELRYKAFQKNGRLCGVCGSEKDLQVDHIKPRKLYPELSLVIENLQILCKACNKGKGAWDETDWRR